MQFGRVEYFFPFPGGWGPFCESWGCWPGNLAPGIQLTPLSILRHRYNVFHTNHVLIHVHVSRTQTSTLIFCWVMLKNISHPCLRRTPDKVLIFWTKRCVLYTADTGNRRIFQGWSWGLLISIVDPPWIRRRNRQHEPGPEKTGQNQ